MISIVMPVKNEATHLDECLQSIIAQTEENWELLAVDDHSSDRSYNILQKYSQKDHRIKPLKNEGKGIIDALETAYQAADGAKFTRMDADDIMSPIKLEELQKTLKTEPDGIAVGKVRYFSDEQLGQGYANYENWLNQLIEDESHYDEIYKECVIPSPNWMMKKETLEKLGGFENLQYPEDYDLCFKAYVNEIPVVGSEKVTHKWRDYPERTSRNHEHYADNRFTSLKTGYFVDFDLNAKKELILWGAGKRGKQIAKELLKRKIRFRWVSNNTKKHGLKIYQVPVESVPMSFQTNQQIIVAIAAKKAQQTILKLTSQHPDTFYFY